MVLGGFIDCSLSRQRVLGLPAEFDIRGPHMPYVPVGIKEINNKKTWNRFVVTNMNSSRFRNCPYDNDLLNII